MFANFSANSSFFKCYRCSKCDKTLKRLEIVKRHSATFDPAPKSSFPGGRYVLSKTVFQELESVGIHVPAEHRYYTSFVAFDFEAFLSRIRSHNQSECSDEMFIETKKLNCTQEDVPCSVALHSNVDISSESKFLSSADPQTLVDDFADYLEDLAQQNETTQAGTFEYECQILEDLIVDCEKRIQKLYRSTRDSSAVPIPTMDSYQLLVSTVRFMV